jgi:hypothetical protein
VSTEQQTSENPEAPAPEPMAPSALEAQAEQAQEHEAEGQPKQEQPKRELPTSIPYNRFSSVVAEKNQAKAEAAELKRQIAEMQGRFQAPQQADDFPDPTKYNSLDEYKAAVRDHAAAQANTVASRHSQQIQQQAEIQTLVSGFNSQAQAMAQTNPQIVEAVQMFAALEGEIHPEVFRAIVAEGPSLVWDIATNQEALDKLIGASPLQAGRILASLGATPSGGKPQAIKPNQAPQRAAIPATRTVSGAARVAENDPSKMTQAEYFAWREKQEN